MSGAEGSSPSTATSSVWKAVLTALIASPFAILFGAPSQPLASADPAPMAAPSIAPGAASAPSADCVRRFLAPLEKLAGEAHREGPATDDWIDQTKSAVKTLRATLGTGSSVDAMIATIADPIDSGLDYHFDTTLQALRLGIEHGAPKATSEYDSFYRDQSWLPWHDTEAPDAAQPQAAQCREAIPGLMLFRTSDGQKARVRLLLLVGETPTSGLHLRAMVNALRLTQALNEPCALAADASGSTAPACATQIVGPSFSGGAFSMHLALEKWATEAGTGSALFHIVTGSATGAGLPRTLGDRAQWRSPLRVWFEATTVPERAVECAYLSLLRHYLREDVEPSDSSETPGSPSPSKRVSNVAMLHESGTEFGASSQVEPPCQLRPAVDIAFPVHISSVRDAYEDLDSKEAHTGKETIARPTSLTVSLREKHQPLDAQADVSPKTTYAQDMALANILTQISIEKVRHVGIHATDVADAIFLARKIRDVAPDVRLAFFDADALLLHPSFQHDLRGSLVVGPYPFLGSSHFGRTGSTSGERVYSPFENGHAEGVFNAVLATRGWSFDELWEYSLPGSQVALPVWRSVIGRDGIVPLSLVPALDCSGTIYRKNWNDNEPGAPPAREVCDAKTDSERASAWARFNTPRTSPITTSVTLPRVWHFLFVLLILAFLIDQIAQHRTRQSLARNPMPATITRAFDRQADLAIGRTKWLLYASIRTFLFALAFGYMAIIYVFSWFVGSAGAGMGAAEVLQCLVLALALSAATVCTVRAQWRFAENYESFACAVCRRSLIAWFVRRLRPFARKLGDTLAAVAPGMAGARETPQTDDVTAPANRPCSSEAAGTPSDSRTSDQSPPTSRESEPPSQLDRIFTAIGVITPASRQAVAQTSFSQLRIIVGLAVILSAFFTALLVFAMFHAADGSQALQLRAAVPLLTLLVLRTVSLANGVSPAAPALLCAACVYAWAAGRMARLAAAHHIARISPDDGEADLVSTPLRVVLYPNRVSRSPSDGGFTLVERAVANAIWRPITGPFYLFAVLVVILIPLVLFALKPLATVESSPVTWLLGGGLAVSASLIGITFIQLVRYWLALELLLKRTMEHPLGPALPSVRPFVRESVDDQLSRSPNDLLRLVGCGRQFGEFVEAAGAAAEPRLAGGAIAALQAAREKVEELRIDALHASSSGSKDKERAADKEAALGRQIIRAAGQVTSLLERAWEGDDAKAAGEAFEEQVPQAQAMGDQSSAGPTGAPDRRGTATAKDRPSGPVARSTSAAGYAPMLPPSRAPDLGSAGEREAPRQGAGPGRTPPEGRSIEPRSNVIDALTPVGWRFHSDELEWLRAGQSFVATVVALIVSRYVRQFKYFLYAMTASMVLLLLAITSYPFEPYRLLLSCIWGIVGSVVGVGVWIFIELDRNTVISHIAGTVPGKLTFDGGFVLRVLAWGVLPVLGVAATAYPEIANALYRIVEPFARALR